MLREDVIHSVQSPETVYNNQQRGVQAKQWRTDVGFEEH